jgi:hypothetical protein
VITRGLAGACVSLLILTSAAISAQVVTGGVEVRTHSSSDPTLRKANHIRLIGCASNDVTIRVTLRRLVNTKSQPVTVLAVLRNVGTAACTYVAPNAAGPLFLGPCGLTSLTVANDKSVDVFPGEGIFSCPAEIYKVLELGASLSVSGSWDQRKIYPSRGFVPRGKYRLTVGNVVTYSVTLR